MITDRLLEEIIREIHFQAEESMIMQHNLEISETHKAYELGKETGLRRAVTIIRKHYLLANPK